MPRAYFKNVVAGTTEGTYTGELTNSTGNREIDFENQPITKHGGGPVSGPGECGEWGCVEYTPGNSGNAQDIVLYANVIIAGNITDNSIQAAIRNLASKIGDEASGTSVSIQRK